MEAILALLLLGCFGAAIVSLIKPGVTTGGRFGRMGGFLLYLFGTFAVLVAIGANESAKKERIGTRQPVVAAAPHASSYPSSTRTAPDQTAAQPGAVQQAPAVPPAPAIQPTPTPAPAPDFQGPPEQVAFVKAVSESIAAYRAAPNEMAAGATRFDRRNKVCTVLRVAEISNWVGKIRSLSSNGDGWGVLAIDIGGGVVLTTWNNAMSDVFDKTLLDPSSALFQTAAQMRKGQVVTFSGAFFPSETDCVKELSMTISGSMKNPEYLVRFTDIR